MANETEFRPVVEIGEWLRANSTHLYKSNRVVLRETLQNAIDAIRMSSVRDRGRVEVSYDRGSRRLTIRDNGIGMSLDEQRDSFWRPYGSKKIKLSDEVRMKKGVIGRFGIGAYSAFRVAQRLTVVSRSESRSNEHVTGTMAALDKPLDDYAAHQTPSISFRVLPASEAEAQWPANHPHGTVIVMDLVRDLDEKEALATLRELSAYVPETVSFQGKPLNNERTLLPSLRPGQTKHLVIDATRHCSTNTLRRLGLNVLVRRDGTAAVELCSASLSTDHGIIDVDCAGVLELTKRNHDGILLLKHGFRFAKIDDTESWVRSVRDGYHRHHAFEFDGVLDLPFLDPDVSREGFSEGGATDMSAVLICVSDVIAKGLELKGGNCLRKCDQLFDYLRSRPHKDRERILKTYPFRLFGTKDRVTLRDLKRRRRENDSLNIVFVTDEADENAEQLARSLATLDDYCVLKLDEPELWTGYVQEQLLEGCFGAKNVTGATSFHSVLDDDDIGGWRDYRAAFTAALDVVLGGGHQVLLAHIEPKSIALVIQADTGIVYLNYHNPDVAELPDRQLLGVSLQAKIRSWAYGKVKAAQLEDALIKEGKLVIVQKVVKVHYVKDPERGNYTPERDHQFLLVDKHGTRYFALRVSDLCLDDLKKYVDQHGGLREGFASQLTWVGSTFYFTISDPRSAIDTLVLTFHTGVALRNPESDSVEGRVDVDLRVERFRGPHLSGSVMFLVLPDWIGGLLEQERTRRGHVMISLWSQVYSNVDDESSIAEPKV